MDLLTAIIAILLILWLLGMLGSVGNLIHILLVIAIILILIRTIQGRESLSTIIVILLILWLLGMLGSIGSLIYLLLVIAIILILIRIIRGREPLQHFDSKQDKDLVVKIARLDELKQSEKLQNDLRILCNQPLSSGKVGDILKCFLNISTIYLMRTIIFTINRVCPYEIVLSIAIKAKIPLFEWC